MIGDSLELRSFRSSNPLMPEHPVILSTRSKEAKLIIGHNFGMTGGGLVAGQTIRIGDRVIIGANSLVTDTDFHPLDPKQRRPSPLQGKTKPVEIGHDVFIGTRAIILKGTKIGAGSVVGAGAVVSGTFVKNSIIAGNPAKIIGKTKS